MSDDDRGLIVIVVGVVTLWVAFGDQLVRFLRPETGKWLIMAGLALVAVGVAHVVMVHRERRSAASDDHEDHDAHEGHGHGHGSRYVGWMLLAPVVVLLVAQPGALGSYAVDRSAAGRLPSGVATFDLEEQIRLHSIGGQAVPLTVLHLWTAVRDEEERALLDGVPIRFDAFVVEPEEDGEMVVARIMVGCCAGDAMALTTQLEGYDGELPETDTWVSVEGELDIPATLAGADPEGRRLTEPVVRVRSVTPISEPELPYLFPN